jgi:hypothetical protein
LLLLKVPFNARISHYGFALAMPGVALLVVTAIDLIPSWLDSRGLGGRLFRVAFRGLLVVFVGSHLLISSWFFAQRTYAMGQGPDTLRVNGRGAVVAQAAQMVLERTQPGETLVVFPEGAMVNYLTRRRSSIPHLDFDPVTLAKDGEDAVLNELKSHPPDHVLAFARHVRDLREYGCVTFGEDCAKEIGAWLKGGYSARVIGVSQRRLMFILLAPISGASPAPSPEIVEVDSLDGAGLQR